MGIGSRARVPSTRAPETADDGPTGPRTRTEPKTVRHPFPASARSYSVTDPSAPGTVGAWRVLRGAVVGTGATLLTVGGHCVAGDEPPTWTTVVSLAVLLGAVSVWLSALRWTFPRLLALLVAAQAGMHVLFVTTRPTAALQGVDPVGPVAGHALHHGASGTHPAAAHVAAHVQTLLPSPLMLAGHLAAAAVTALLLWRGEEWLAGVLDALALRAYRVLSGFTPFLGTRPGPVLVLVYDAARPGVAADAWWQRGPPR